jgi:hypothetical protein
VVPKTVKTPVGMDYEGVSFQGRICGVSIMRGKLRLPATATEADLSSWRGVTARHQIWGITDRQAMEAGLRDCCRSGKLIDLCPQVLEADRRSTNRQSRS